MASSVMETRNTNAACFLRSRTNTSRILSASPELGPNLSASSGLYHPAEQGKEGSRETRRGGKSGQRDRARESQELGDRGQASED